MPTTWRVQHCFQGTGGTSKDMYCNQFYAWHPTNVVGDVATWGPVLASKFHQLWSVGGSPPSLSYWMSPRVDNNLGVTKIYDAGASGASISGPPAFVISDSTLVPAGYLPETPSDVKALPEEVAVCLSYTAVHTEGDLPRRRGRIYLGPLNVNAIGLAGGDGGPMVVSPTLIERALAAAVTTLDSLADDGWEWRVYSTMDGFAFNIVEFSMDNAFDTVRGRGTAPSSRIFAAV